MQVNNDSCSSMVFSLILSVFPYTSLTSWSHCCSATCVCRLCFTETTYMLKSPIAPCCPFWVSVCPLDGLSGMWTSMSHCELVMRWTSGHSSVYFWQKSGCIIVWFLQNKIVVLFTWGYITFVVLALYSKWYNDLEIKVLTVSFRQWAPVLFLLCCSKIGGALYNKGYMSYIVDPKWTS